MRHVVSWQQTCRLFVCLFHPYSVTAANPRPPVCSDAGGCCLELQREEGQGWTLRRLSFLQQNQVDPVIISTKPAAISIRQSAMSSDHAPGATKHSIANANTGNMVTVPDVMRLTALNPIIGGIIMPSANPDSQEPAVMMIVVSNIHPPSTCPR